MTNPLNSEKPDEFKVPTKGIFHEKLEINGKVVAEQYVEKDLPESSNDRLDELDKLIYIIQGATTTPFIDPKLLKGTMFEGITPYTHQELKYKLSRLLVLERLDELGGVQLDYGHRVAQTFINGEAMTVAERYEQLQSQLEAEQQ